MTKSRRSKQTYPEPEPEQQPEQEPDPEPESEPEPQEPTEEEKQKEIEMKLQDPQNVNDVVLDFELESPSEKMLKYITNKSKNTSMPITNSRKMKS